MKQKLLYTLLALLGLINLKAQETLIFSTSFEIDSSRYCKHSTIVNGYDTLGLDFYNYYPDMFNAIGTPDIFSPCDSFWYHISETDSLRMHYKNGWPQNFLGFQYPHYGNNYAGFLSYTYPINNNFRVEWIGIKLPVTLIKNRFYRVEYYVSTADYSGYYTLAPQVSFKADSVFGGYSRYLTNIDLGENPLNNTDISLEQEGIITDTINWVKISGLYKSDGNERYVYIGNFYSNIQTPNISGSTSSYAQDITYYYIDDFSIYDIDSTITSVENITHKNEVKIHPNPATQTVSINVPANYPNPQLYIYNLTGQLVATKPIKPNQPMPITELSAGMYIFSIQSNNNLIGRQRVVVY